MATRYSLYMPVALQAMVSREPDVMKHVQAFANDEADDVIEVAGPPLPQELARARKFDQTVPLPCVTLHLRKVKHHLTGHKMIEIACSDDDLVEVERWNMVARQRVRKTIAAGAAHV